jgi:tetratricopeptide (TPR) repeat protein
MPIWRLTTLAVLAGAVACPFVPAQAPPAPLDAANARGPDDLGEVGGSSRPLEQSPGYRLLTSKAILVELRLSDAQKTRLAAVPEAVRVRNQARRTALARVRSDADAALHKQVHAFEKSVEEALAEVLTPAQVARLHQLGWQQLGLHAFQHPELRQVLRLTTDQDTAVVRCHQEWQRRGLELQHEITREAGGDLARADVPRYRKRCAELTHEVLGQVEALLDPAQRRAWRELIGEPGRLADGSPEAPDARLFLTVGSNLRLSILLLLGHSELPRELDLKQDQARSLAALPKKLLDALHPEALHKLHLARLEAHHAETQLALDLIEEARTRALEVLSPTQTQRLRQLELQTLGLWAFGSPAALEALNLTSEQDSLIGQEGLKVQMAGHADQANLPNDPNRKLTMAARKLAGPMKEGVEQVLASFDANQKKTWSALVGTPFDVSRITEFSVHDVAFTHGTAAPATQAWRHAGQRLTQKKYPEARVLLEEAARLAPKDPQALSSLAWFLATGPEDKLRDGARAVKLAELAVELAGDRFPMLYDTLAATYAETGDFEAAIKTASHAFEQAPLTQKGAVESRLVRYREKKPAHD